MFEDVKYVGKSKLTKFFCIRFSLSQLYLLFMHCFFLNKDDYQECEDYDETTAVESEYDSEPVMKRKPKKKVMSDFIMGEHAIYLQT